MSSLPVVVPLLSLSSLPLDSCQILLLIYFLEWVKCVSGFAVSHLSLVSRVFFLNLGDP